MELDKTRIINEVISETGVKQLLPVEDVIIGDEEIREEIQYIINVSTQEAMQSREKYREAVLHIISEQAVDESVQEATLHKLGIETEDLNLFTTVLGAVIAMEEEKIHRFFHAVFDSGNIKKILILLSHDYDHVFMLNEDILNKLSAFMTSPESELVEKAAVLSFIDSSENIGKGLESLYKNHSEIVEVALELLKSRHLCPKVISALCAAVPTDREDLASQMAIEVAKIYDDQEVLESIDPLEIVKDYAPILIAHCHETYPNNRLIKSAIQILAKYDSQIDIDINLPQAFIDQYLEEVRRLQVKDNKDSIDEVINLPSSKAVLSFVRGHRPKAKLFAAASEHHEAVFEDPQSWISINNPKQANKLFETVFAQIDSGKRTKVMRSISQKLGRTVHRLDEVDFKYYPDEIIDGLLDYIKQNPRLASNEDIKALIQDLKFVNDVKIRFIKREEPDLSLGNKCGDCSARGSINFENALSWYLNPNYQILTLGHGKRFIGRLNISIGDIDGNKTIWVDATEFNPQTQRIPRYEQYGKECLKEAALFLAELAKKSNAQLFFYTGSNSSEFSDELAKLIPSDSLEEERLLVSPYFPSESIRQIFSEHGYTGPVKCFYQAFDMSDAQYERDHLDNLSIQIEREVFNPAQIEDSIFQTHMRDRNFQAAAKHILQNPKYKEILSKILKMTPSVALLVNKMKAIYPSQIEESQQSITPQKIDSSSFMKVKT